MKTVSIQGDKASFHDIARNRYFSEETTALHRDSFEKVFSDVDTGKADFGLVAIENSLYGSINETYDLLLRYDFWISGEVYLHIKHNLIGLPGARIEQIESVYSQRFAIAQSIQFLNTALPDAHIHATHDTAASVALIAHDANPKQAAIASSEAAELHGLSILAEGIETNKKNYTRFIVISKEKLTHQGANKTSIILKTPDEPGALYKALGLFAELQINLTKIESRPVPDTDWHYMFYVDFEAGLDDEASKLLLDRLEKQGYTTTVLGTYLESKLPIISI